VRVLRLELRRWRQPDLLKERHDGPLGVLHLGLVQLHRAGQVVADRVYRVQRAERVLEDVLHLALVLAERAAAVDVDLLAVQGDRPVGPPFLAGQ
jgi:hypothetical protein